MRIGIDISQIVYEGTGVARYVRETVAELLRIDQVNEYVLFGASLRNRHVFYNYFANINQLNRKVRLISIPIPPTLLEFFWNKLHIVPIEWFTGPLDVFWSNDWSQPPLKQARGVTTIHDLIALKYPEETHAQTDLNFKEARISANIVEIQKRRLNWVKKECDVVLCDSKATKQDAIEILQIDARKLRVVYPGFN